MLIHVLGSAAGGGFPQWNCGCPNCRGVRAGAIRATPRTQESVAVTANGRDWLLLNASPEVRQQIEGAPALHPRAPRDSPIQGIALTNGDLDHCLGLLSLRESHPLRIYATEPVFRGFRDGNVLFRTLERTPDQVTFHAVKPGREDEVLGAGGRPSGLTVEPVAVPGKPPVHLEGLRPPDPEDAVGLVIRERTRRRRLAYFSGVGAVTAAVRAALAGADAVFFDGTFWASDELIALGVGDRRAEQMAHVPVGGPDGSLAALRGLQAGRRVLIHLNNTNPLLREDSPERAAAVVAGWEIAWDGMTVELP